MSSADESQAGPASEEVWTGPRATMLFAVSLILIGMMAPVVGISFLATLPVAWWLVAAAAAVGGPAWFLGSAFTFGHLFQYRVRVGADGVHLRRAWRGYSRFVPWSKIEEVVTEGGRLELALHDGERVYAAPYQANIPLNVRRMRERLGHALAAFRARPRTERALVLQPGDRSVEQWTGTLRAMARADYRSPALTRAELLATIEDPSAPPAVRVGAAVAIEPEASGQERARISKAAETSAAPRVRVALELLASEDRREEELYEVLDEVRSERVGG